MLNALGPHLRDQGFQTYDFGGYAAGTTDPALQHINEFKDVEVQVSSELRRRGVDPDKD